MALTTIPDIDIYLLYYLDLQSLLPITLLCKRQNGLLSDQVFIKELRLLKQKHKKVNANNIISYASRYNYIAIINWVHKSKNKFNYEVYALYKACQYGNIQVLDWFDKYNYMTIDKSEASKYGSDGILKYFGMSKYEFKYSYAIIYACENGHVSILQWFADKNIFTYDYGAIDAASMNGHICILEWFNKSEYDFVYTHDAIDLASKNGYINVLEWFDKSRYEFIYTNNAIDLAASNCHIDVLQWFDKSRYEFLYTYNAINLAASNVHVLVLKWFDKSKYEFLYTKRAINLAACNAHIDILEWFDKSGYEFKFKQKTITNISNHYEIEVLEWFDKSKYLFSYKTIFKLERNGHTLRTMFISCKSYFMCEALYLTACHRKIGLLDLFKNCDYELAFVYKLIKINKYKFYPDVQLWFKKNIRKYLCTVCSKKIKIENQLCKQCVNNNNITNYRNIINVVMHVSLLGFVIFAKKYLN